MLHRRKIYAIIILFLIAAATAVAVISVTPHDNETDIVYYNRIASELGENWQAVIAGTYSAEADGVTVVDTDGNTLLGAKIGNTYQETMNRAAVYGYSSLDIVVDGNIAGKLIIITDNQEHDRQLKRELGVTITIFFGALMIILISLILYFELIINKPFRKMTDYAANIAGGNLEMPLEMDRGNIFGAFTESFNTMRLQLKSARIAEHKAKKDKEDFINSVNHDMLAPLSVIKTAAESINAEENEKYIRLIKDKTEEVEHILNDLLSANLSDSMELKMNIAEVTTDELIDIIRTCDYKRRVRTLDIEKCIILCDKVRTSQIFANIITNSYKYADTEIDIAGRVNENRLVVSIKDYGDYINPGELYRFTERYFRGRNAADKSGAGLGLYIVDNLQRKQGGEVQLEYDDGLTVLLVFQLA